MAKATSTQAEAVIDLIRAELIGDAASATNKLEGRLGDQIRKIRDELIAVLAHINASIDFPEEGIEPDEDEALRGRLDLFEMNRRVARDRRSRSCVARRCARGDLRCNMRQIEFVNRLLGDDRVIVSDTHGA